MPLCFDVTRAEHALIVQIAERADHEVFKPLGVDQSRLQSVMDLSACHATGCALDLAKLLGAHASDLAHDVAGIRRHIDRASGVLENGFVPRCAR